MSTQDEAGEKRDVAVRSVSLLGIITLAQRCTAADAADHISENNQNVVPRPSDLPLDPTVQVIHMGDITELGNIVAGAFAHPDEAGHGEYLPLVGDFMSFDEIVETLNRQGHVVMTTSSGVLLLFVRLIEHQLYRLSVGILNGEINQMGANFY